MRIVLTGATGCVGAAFLRGVHGESDVEVVATARGESRARPACAAEWLSTSLADLPARLDDVGPFDACVHAAAVVHRPRTPEAEVRRVNVDQTLALARAFADRSPGARFVFISSIAALEPGRSTYAASKADAETALAALAGEGRLDVVALRLATVYGPDDRGNIGSLARAIASGIYVRTAPPGVRKTMVWSRAVAAAIRVAVDRSRACAPVSVVADPHPYELGEIEDALAEAVGARRPRRLPAPLATALGAAGTAVERVTGYRAPFSLSRLRTLRREVVVPPVGEGALGEAVEEALRGVPLVERFREAYGGLGTLS